MLYETAAQWRAAPKKRVLLFGMSGLGKTVIANMLRYDGGWFHYSVDYRIGTRYMGELIADNAKKLAMQVPLLRELLMSDSIFIGSNITFNNLAPLSSYLGKPGNAALGGLPIDEYRLRQAQHREAEINALLDAPRFIERAESLYGYKDFLCDSGGSICEVVSPGDPDDPVLTALSNAMLLVWIRDDEQHREALIRRFDRAPKPMYYAPDFLTDCWQNYMRETGLAADDVEPDAFIRWAYGHALAHRRPLYSAMSRWGISVDASDVAKVATPEAFNALISRALEARAG